MSDIRERLRRMQRSQLLGQLSTTDRLIRQIFARSARRLEREAAGAKDESLTKRWAEDYRRAVGAELGRMNAEIERAITRGAESASEIRAAGIQRYLDAVAGAAGVELSDRFTDVLSRCRTDALRAMIDGRMYRDGRELSKRIWSATGRLEGAIEEIVAQGVAQQQSTYQIARALEAYVNPKATAPMDWQSLYPDTPFHMNVDYNATRLARTAINHVFWQTGVNAAKENPFCAAMHWELSNAHYERQVLTWGRCACDEYAAHDEGLGRGNFAPENLPRPHPNCLCLQYEVLPAPEDAADRLRAWMDGAEDPELEAGFGRFVERESASRTPGRTKPEATRRQDAAPELRRQLDNLAKPDTMDTERVARALSEAPAIPDPKIYGYMLNPARKHYHEFVEAGYAGAKDGERLRADILRACRQAPREQLRYHPEYRQVRYAQHIRLGPEAHRFRVAWKLDADGDAPQLVTCYRKEEST